MSKRVLITGAAGFAGAYLAPVLTQAGFEVTGLAKGGDEPAVDNLRLCPADLLDFEQLGEVVARVKPTHVAHLAAISFVGHGNVSEIYETNIVGTRNLLKALSALEDRPEAVVLTSSANVYGNSDKGVVSETDDVNPANDYAVSKIAMEYMSRQFFDTLNIIIARPFNYTGRGQALNFLVPKIVQHFRERAEVIELGNIDVSRDFSDVRMVAHYFSRLLQSPTAIGQVYNICSGVPYSLNSIIETCAQITGHSLKVRVNPAFVRPNEIKSLVGSPAKLHRDVGRIESFPLRTTLEWMLEA